MPLNEILQNKLKLVHSREMQSLYASQLRIRCVCLPVRRGLIMRLSDVSTSLKFASIRSGFISFEFFQCQCLHTNAHLHI